MNEIIRRQKWPTEAEMKQDLLDGTRAALRLVELLEEQWPPAAGPPQERLEKGTISVTHTDRLKRQLPFIDENIRTLVELLNTLPGIRTRSSCGGHAKPNSIQVPLGHWWVGFTVAPTRGGWRSLELIAGLNHFTRVEVHSHEGRASRYKGRSLRFALSSGENTGKRKKYNKKYKQNVPVPTPENVVEALRQSLER